ncbi:protease, partial [Xanthomonas citri pv. citri]|nr:protease [Xanthomonas citri pv. citri]
LIAAPVASANNAPPADEGQTRVGKSDDRPNPLAEKKADLRDAAVSALVTGKAATKKVNGKRVIEVKGKDKKGKTKPRYVQY